MKKYYLFLIIFTNLCCNNKIEYKSIVGIYKSSKLNFIEKIKFNSTKDINGLKLILEKDNTFYYETCGLIINGFWNTKNDTLKLNVKNINFKNDSINKIKIPETKRDFLIYKIEGNLMFGFIHEKNGLRINKLERK